MHSFELILVICKLNVSPYYIPIFQQYHHRGHTAKNQMPRIEVEMIT